MNKMNTVIRWKPQPMSHVIDEITKKHEQKINQCKNYLFRSNDKIK